MLRFIQRKKTDPYYNIAAEEYLLKAATVNTFMTWRNEPSVIIGKHQNTSREINHHFIESNHLPVIRRITGGGTVYHDPGNINFSFIFTDRKENLIDFREFTKPVILFLQTFGLNAAFEGKNNITVDGLKVSGNSAHLYKNKVLYHGTLLFKSDLEKLEAAIAGREELFADKAIRSVRAKVTNIHDLLVEKISIEEFINLFQKFIFNYYGNVYEDKIDDLEEVDIQTLATKKYRSIQWNYGYSPDYEFTKKWVFHESEYIIHLKVRQGIIQEAKISGTTSLSALLETIVENIIGSFHERNAIDEIIGTLAIADENKEIILNQIITHLF